MTDWQAAWKRLSDGQHVVLCGAGPIPDPDPGRVHLSWVDCAAHREPGGTIEAARRRIDRDLDINPWVDVAAQRIRSGLRRHLLGEDPDDIDMARDEHTFRRAVAAAEGPRSALLLSGVDRADPASLERLTRLFAGEHRPTWPLLIRFDAREPTGPARALLEQLERVLPPEAIFRGAEGGAPIGRGSSPANALGQLSPESLRVLRAAATIGDRFEIETVAELLELDELAVLDAIQEAFDRGLTLEDRGHGIFRFQPQVASAVRAATLPTLSSAWHRRLAELFGGPPAPVDTAASATREEVASAAAIGSAPKTVSPPAEPGAGGTECAPPSPEGSVGDGSPVRAAADEGNGAARAARRAKPAGLPEDAARHYLSAAMAAASSGRYALALDVARRALALTERAAEPDRQQLAARALLVIGQCRWLDRGEEPASLDLALEALERARALVVTGSPLEIHAEIAALIANVCYDIGSPEALERALVEITRAGQLWMDAARPLEAARLLNDEAAIWAKGGNFQRASQLLVRSREVFGKLASGYPAARLELLETEHLLARMMLHSPVQPGRDGDACQAGVEHAVIAEAGYRALNNQRQLGRVWETLGRLQLRVGHLDEAANWLERAHRLQREIGDAIGSARSAGGMSEVFAATHDYARALNSLAESVTFNSEKGSAAGLEYNLASLRQLEAHLPALLVDQAQALGQRLARAMSVN